MSGAMAGIPPTLAIGGAISKAFIRLANVARQTSACRPRWFPIDHCLSSSMVKKPQNQAWSEFNQGLGGARGEGDSW